MVLEFIVKDIQKLIAEKKYDEVIEKSEKLFPVKKRPPFLSNIIGTAKMLRQDRSEEDIRAAINCFELAYTNDKNSITGFLAVCNLISAITQNLKNHSFLEWEIKKAKNLYLDAEKFHQNKDKFLKAGYDLFVILLDHEKIKQICNNILKLEKKNKFILSNCIFSQLYYYDWGQKEYYEQSKIHSKYFNELKVKDLDYSLFKQNKKINLGFVGNDFRLNHSVTYFLKKTFKYLDKSKFNIFLFSVSKRDINDQSQNELIDCVDYWVDLENLNNQEIVNIIQEKKIGILIDIMGLTKSSRVEIFKSRIAPIQISWLAYCNTLGFENIDYLIADHNLIYPEEEKFYTEKILKMPDVWNSHSGFDFESKFNNPPSIENDSFTFGSFNNARKISDETVEVWSKILKNIPNSKLILKSSLRFDYRVLLDKFEKYGVKNKIEILDRKNFIPTEHLNLYKKIDVALDTFPYNGVTTTFEALWMNVPVIVMKGFNFNSRCGESIIKNSKIDFLISKDKNEYINKAIKLAEHKDLLIDIKNQLAKTILSTPLFDSKKFAYNFGKTLSMIYEQFT